MPRPSPRYTLSCAHCGDSFTVEEHRRDTARYCSRACHNTAQSQRVSVTCVHCGTEFLAKRGELARDGGKYCSAACYHARPRQSNNPIVVCAHCGNQFTGKAYRDSKFCSLACYTGRKIALTCQQCGATFHRKASNAPKARYCSYACSNLAKSGDVAARFWSNVDKSAGPDGCWLWTASATHAGYGRFNDRGKPISAHRWSYEAAYGPLTDDVLVQHSCDTPGCVNPAHLFPGTNATNTTDSVLKGRNVRGERCHTAKLTDDQVIAIRRRYHAGGVSQTQLAAEYGVRARLIGRVVRRESWQHLP